MELITGRVLDWRSIICITEENNNNTIVNFIFSSLQSWHCFLSSVLFWLKFCWFESHSSLSGLLSDSVTPHWYNSLKSCGRGKHLKKAVSLLLQPCWESTIFPFLPKMPTSSILGESTSSAAYLSTPPNKIQPVLPCEDWLTCSLPKTGTVLTLNWVLTFSKDVQHSITVHEELMHLHRGEAGSPSFHREEGQNTNTWTTTGERWYREKQKVHEQPYR